MVTVPHSTDPPIIIIRCNVVHFIVTAEAGGAFLVNCNKIGAFLPPVITFNGLLQMFVALTWPPVALPWPNFVVLLQMFVALT